MEGQRKRGERMPTPTTQDAKNNCGPSQGDRDALNVTVGGALNPEWVEWLMGWVRGWTSLQPLPSHAVPYWLRAHTGEAASWWTAEPDGVPRVATKVPNRVDRLTAIGNGQVPAACALAWRILAGQFKHEKVDDPS